MYDAKSSTLWYSEYEEGSIVAVEVDRMVQIKDIAAKAGVSPATVSLVLNNKPGISEETRNAVMRVVQDLGYTRPKCAPHAACGTAAERAVYHL